MATTEEEVTSYATEASGSTTTVNEAAKILVHATKTGDNLDTASRNLPLIPTTLKTFDIYNDPTQPAPLLNDYISSHPVRQKAVERDIPNYSYTERTMGKLSSLWGKTTKSMEQQRLALSIADYRHGNLAGKFLPDQERIKDDLELASAQARYDALGSELKDLTKYDTGEDDITDIGLGVAQLGIQMLGAPVANPKVAATAAGAAIAGSVTVSPLTAGASLLAAAPAGSIAAVTAGSVEDNFRITAGQIYQQAYLDNPRRAFIDDKEAYTIALGAAAASSGLEYLQVGGLLNKVPGIKSVTRKGVIEALKRGERGGILVAAKLAGEAIKSGAEEFGQQVIQDVATQTAEGRNLEKGIGEKILIASTSKEAAQSFAIGALAAPTVHVVTSKARTAYGHIVDMNEALGEAGAVNTGGGDGGGEKPKGQYRFIIQDADVKKAAQAEKTAQFITQVAETKYNESNPDLVETVEKSISPEGYGYIHTDEMSQLTAQDQRLLQKWNSFTGQLNEGVKVVRISNADIVTLQRINKDVANIYRVKPNEPSVRSHQAWMQKIEDNAQRVQQIMEGLGAVNRDVSQLTEADVVHRPEVPKNVIIFEDEKLKKEYERLQKVSMEQYGIKAEEGIDKFIEEAEANLDSVRAEINEAGGTLLLVPEHLRNKLKDAENLVDRLDKIQDHVYAVTAKYEKLQNQQLNELTSKPEDFSPVPANLVPIFHGTRAEFESPDFRSGGMIFFGENREVAERYSQGSGGGRTDDLSKMTMKILDSEGGLRYDKKTKKWNGEINGEKLSLTSSQIESRFGSENLYAEHDNARVIESAYNPEKSLDITSENGEKLFLNILEKLKNNETAQRIFKSGQDRYSGVNAEFWGQTKFASKLSNVNDDFIEITKALKAEGYDSIRFKDDQHVSVALFDNAILRNISEINNLTSKPEDFSPVPANLELPQANTLNAVNETLQGSLDSALESNDDATINAVTNGLMQHIITQEIPAVEKSKLASQFKALDLNLTKRKLTDILVNAKQVILNTKISQLDPRQFAENARQYGKEASLALQNNDPVAYVHAKQLQLTNLQAIVELRNVRAGLNNFSQTVATLSDPEVLRKLRTLNDKHADFIENTVALFTNGEKARLDRDAYLQSQQSLQDNNLPTVEVPEALFDVVGVDPRGLSVQQLQAVDAALKTAQSAAQNELKLFRLEEAKELNEVVEQHKVRLSTRKDADPNNYVKLQSMLEETNLTKWKQLLNKINPLGYIRSATNAIFNNVADITRYDLDLGENNGYFTRTYYNPLIEASNEKSQLIKTFNDVIADVVKFYGVKEWSRLERDRVNFLGKQLSRAELILMSSYLGTESSQKRLAQWLKATVPDITAELERYVSHKDVANMQKIVNFYSSVVLPKERALNQRMAIPPLKEIDALPFTFDGKTFKGGYLPLNTMADFMTKANREGTSYVENVRAGKIKAEVQTHDRTFDVHELNREGSDLPIDLTITGLRDSFDMRAHDLAYRETAHDLTKILTDKDNQKYLVGVLGLDKYAHLHDAIQTIIGNRYNSEVRTEQGLRKLYGDIGTNAVFAALGGNINTLFKQTQSLPLMVGELASASGNGAVTSTLSATRHLLAAMSDVLTNPVSWYQQAEFIAKLDADFADKFQKWNRDNPDFLRLAKSFDPSLDQIQDHRKWMITRGWQSFRSMSLAPLSMVSLYLNTIQWTAAYNMAMNGEVKNVKPTQTEAALHATKAVRFALERNETFEKSDIQKLWYMKPFTFMTNQASVQGAAVLGQFNVANRMGKIDPATRKYMYTKAFTKGFMTVAVPSMIIKLLLGRATKEKDEETGEQVMTQEFEKLINNPKTWIAKNAAWSLADTVPIVSSISYMAQGNLEYGNPITDVGVGAAATIRSGLSIMVGDEPNKEEQRKARKFLFGSLLGVPFQKIQTAIFDAAYKTYKESGDEGDPLYDTSHNAAIEDNPTPSPLLYQSFWAATGLLYQFGKPQMMDAGSESAEDIIDGMKEDSANNRSNPGLQMARSAEIRTSSRGYLMNPEFQRFTRYFDNGNTDTLSLSAAEEKDWEIYLDTIGRKETANYTKLKNPESSASGYLQILDGTVNNLANLYPHFSEYKGKSAIDLPTDIQFAMGRTLFGERYPDLRKVEVESQVDRFTLWYLASHVLPPISGDRILKAYSEGKMTKQISYLISKAELDSNPVLFGKSADKLTLEKVLDRVKNGYEFKGKTIRGIRDYLEMAQADADKGIGKLE